VNMLDVQSWWSGGHSEILIHVEKGKGVNQKARKISSFAALPGLPLVSPEPLKNFGVDKTA